MRQNSITTDSVDWKRRCSINPKRTRECGMLERILLKLLVVWRCGAKRVDEHKGQESTMAIKIM